MGHVYGPVQSRRLGLSLGVDPILAKACNWNCVYCQLGSTSPMTVHRRSYCDPHDVLQEVETELSKQRKNRIDWITLVGSGETLLSSDIGKLIRGIKSVTTIPVAVITNGSLLEESAVAEELMPANAVLPSLDSGDEYGYLRLNRPHPASTYQGYISGLKSFRRLYQGCMWIEVMMIRDMNDDDASLQLIYEKLVEINPDEVHLLTPTRPPAEPWVMPTDSVRMLYAASLIGQRFKVVVPKEPEQDLSPFTTSLPSAVKEIITRHPLREEVLNHVLEKFKPEEAERIRRSIFSDGMTDVIERMGIRFIVTRISRYPREGG